MRATKKTGLVAVVALALLLGLAAPAGASNPMRVVSGTLTTALGDFDLTPGSGGGVNLCPPKPTTLVATTAANGTWTLTGGFSGEFELPVGSGTVYQGDFTVLPGSGGGWQPQVSPGTHPLTGIVAVRLDVYRVRQGPTGPVDCTKSVRVCRITGVTTVQAPSTYKAAGAGGVGPGLPTTAVGDKITLWATSSPLVVSGCAPPFNAVGGTTASLTALQAALV